jgi:adenylate cyclase
MADLVGYVAYTARAGDAAAHAIAAALGRAATKALRERGGDVVKLIGDGVLATAPSVARAVDAARAIAGACRDLDGGPWMLRAAVHAGRPVAHRGDLFGADVNLVSRLCALAPAGQVLVTGGGEAYPVRGLDEPVAAKALAL